MSGIDPNWIYAALIGLAVISFCRIAFKSPPEYEFFVATVHPLSERHTQAAKFLELSAKERWELITILEYPSGRGQIVYQYYFRRVKT